MLRIKVKEMFTPPSKGGIVQGGIFVGANFPPLSNILSTRLYGGKRVGLQYISVLYITLQP